MQRAREEIYNYLVKQILQGDISPNDPIPTETRLAEMFRANRMDARFAVRILEQKGVVRRKKRQGTRLSRIPSPSLARDLTSALCREAHVIATPGNDPIHWSHLTLQEMERTLKEDGYAMVLEGLPAGADRAGLEEMLERIAAKGAAALVLMPTLEETRLYLANLDLLYQYHSNIYVFDYGGTPPEKWPFHVLSLHPFGEGAQVAQYLYDSGFRRIAFLPQEGMARVYWTQQRELGLCYGLLRASNGSLRPESWRLPSNGDEVCRRLAKARGRYAVVAANDQHAAWLLDRARRAGLEAPRDFSLVSFDNDPRFRSCNLTTVAPPLARIGRMIAQLVSGKLLPKEDGNRLCVSVKSEIIERGTCQAAPTGPQAADAKAGVRANEACRN